MKQQWDSLTWAYSPCPNDTYIFYALAHNLLPAYASIVSPHLADIAELNQSARNATYDVVKISAALYPEIASQYQILATGGAFGKEVGPIFVKRRGVTLPSEPRLWRVLVPGFTTTAHRLLELYYPAVQHRSERIFSEIAPAVARGDADAGVLIHEGRFTFEALDLELIADFGALWFKQYALPLPLGLIVVRRSLPIELKKAVREAIASSIRFADANPTLAVPYMCAHAQEMDTAVMQAHVNLYVNELTRHMGTAGIRALERLYAVKALASTDIC